MSEVRAHRIGTALRQMAEDLAAERRRSTFLARENRELRAQLERLQNAELERLREAELERLQDAELEWLRRAAPGLAVRPRPRDDARARSVAGSS